MKRIEGRRGTATEFVEFQVNKHCNIVAQKGAGGFWFIFKAVKGPNGSVQTLDCCGTKDEAVKKAQEIAEGQ